MYTFRYPAIAALLLCAQLPASAEPRARAVLEGTASVVDGDTIEVHGEQVRLHGFDTPEAGSRCGEVNVYQEAALALADFIGTQTVTCEISGTDRYKRKVGTCRVGGRGLAEHMVASGWGRDWPRYSKGAYADAEDEARVSAAGIWGLACPAGLWGSRKYD